MKVQVEELSPIEKKLSIEVEPTRVREQLDRAYSVLGRSVKIPGFRPGKVPRRILEQRFREQVEDDVVQALVQSAYLDAIREHKVDVVAQPQITNPSPIKPDAPFSFEARVDVRPKVEAKVYEGLELTRQDISVPDEKVNEQLERMRQSMGRLEPVTDRDVAQKGDWAQIDFTAEAEGKAFPGSKAEDISVEIADGELIKGNIAELAGVKVGETKDVSFTFPADYQVEEVRNKTATFHITLKSLKRQVTPELNDDFAKEVQGGETLEELKKKVREQIERSLKNSAAQKERDEILQKLVEKNPFEVPKSMIDRAVDVMLRGALRTMTQQGIDPRYLQFDFDKLREEMRPRAEAEVKGTLLLEAIAEQQQITVTEEEQEKKLEALAAEANVPLSQLRKQFKDEESREALAMRLREEKTIEFLKSRAKYS
ncbi:MAG: trigger factor [Myxococcaceae bacterium]|nr:trigger factor [Myxococcaceae bacterium]